VFVGIDRDRDGDDPEVVRAVAWHAADGRLVILGYDLDELEDVQNLIVRALGLGLLPALVLSLAAGVTLARRAQHRIGLVHEAVGRIVQGHLAERLPLRGSGDDMDRLAMAVNGMLGEIEHLVGEIQGVGDNIAHDLRTPLTRVRARLERGREEATTPEDFRLCIDRSIASVDQALSVVSAVLRIGEIEHGRRRSGFTRIDLSQVARDAFELYEPLAEERGLTLQLSAESKAPAIGDADLLLEAIGNLLDNALKYGPPGSVVVLAVRRDAGELVMSVVDRGPGIAIADRDRVLQRFQRLEKSRTVSGSGLGLSLVAAITVLHGFRLRIGDAQPGCTVDIVCG
jgi:signal transduction histidine kinase